MHGAAVGSILKAPSNVRNLQNEAYIHICQCHGQN